jgi:hypothetical protein
MQADQYCALQTRGNVLKIDRHKYVKVAYHGFRQFTSSERQTVYETSAVRDSFDEPAYAMIDTLFSLAEAHLFMRLVELMVRTYVCVEGGCVVDKALVVVLLLRAGRTGECNVLLHPPPNYVVLRRAVHFSGGGGGTACEC